MMKQERREIKKEMKRKITGEEVIFIFEKVLEDWKTIRIFNTLIQNDPTSGAVKKKVETIATGNCKVFEREFDSKERFIYYQELREKVYLHRK
jgi:hypothetical protein